MTEEENRVIEDLKKEISKPLEAPEDKFNTFILYNIESTRIILNLIEKLQKENEKSKENYEKLLAGYNKIVKEIIEFEESVEEECITKQEVKENYIPKSKIRKIEDELVSFDFETTDYNDLDFISKIIQDLKETIEGE